MKYSAIDRVNVSADKAFQPGPHDIYTVPYKNRIRRVPESDTRLSKLMRRVVAPIATVAILGTSVGFIAHDLRQDAREKTVPAADEPHKYFHLGDTFEVNGKEVTINNLEQAAELADVGDSHNITEMLRKQIPEGETERTLGGTETFDLPIDAQIGTTYIPE